MDPITKKARQYLAESKIRLSGYSVVTVDEAIRFGDLLSQAEKEAALNAFCTVNCQKPCAKRGCVDYLKFCGLIGYDAHAVQAPDEKPAFQQQTLF